jgi:hypothetical protein
VWVSPPAGGESGNELDEIGLAVGAGFLEQAAEMAIDRGLRDAESRCDLGNASDLVGVNLWILPMTSEDDGVSSARPVVFFLSCDVL